MPPRNRSRTGTVSTMCSLSASTVYASIGSKPPRRDNHSRHHLDVLHAAAVGAEPPAFLANVSRHGLAISHDDSVHRADHACGARGYDVVICVLPSAAALTPARGLNLDPTRRVRNHVHAAVGAGVRKQPLVELRLGHAL